MPICDEALERIGKAIKAYRNENDDEAPETLDVLVECKAITPWDLVCPVSPFSVGDSSYVYRGDDIPGYPPAEMIVAHDKIACHKGRRNILFANGHVKRPPEKLFESFVRKDNELRKLLNLPEKKVPVY